MRNPCRCEVGVREIRQCFYLEIIIFIFLYLQYSYKFVDINYNTGIIFLGTSLIFQKYLFFRVYVPMGDGRPGHHYSRGSGMFEFC